MSCFSRSLWNRSGLLPSGQPCIPHQTFCKMPPARYGTSPSIPYSRGTASVAKEIPHSISLKKKQKSSFLNLHQEQSCGVSPASFSHCWHLSKSTLCWDRECDCVTPWTGCNWQLQLQGAVQRPRLSLWVGPSDRATRRGRTWSARPRVCVTGSVTVGRVSFIGTTALPGGKCTDPLGGEEMAGVLPSGQAF